MNNKVNILLSAYNGELYIEEQIESILNQTYKNFTLYIRDDGSKDNTIDVIKKYENDDRVVIIEGENTGFVNSFFELLCLSGDADYYSFSDQDDVWLPNKVEKAIEKLKDSKKDVPTLYCSNYDYYNQNMEFVEHSKTHLKGASYPNSLVDCIALGFNTVINKCTRDLIVNDRPEQCCSHDWWCYMICTAMGEVIYDHEYTTKYRRHESAVSPQGMGFVKFQLWRIKKFFGDDYFVKITDQINEFYTIYNKKLRREDKDLTELFLGKKYSIKKAIKKAFYPKKFRQGTLDEIMLRTIFLIGKM